MSKLLCAFGRHVYNSYSVEMEFMDEKPDYWLYRATNTCMYCGKKREDVIAIPIPSELRRTNK